MYLCVSLYWCVCVFVRLAFQSLQNIAADLPDWRSDVITGLLTLISLSLSLSVSVCSRVHEWSLSVSRVYILMVVWQLYYTTSWFNSLTLDDTVTCDTVSCLLCHLSLRDLHAPSFTSHLPHTPPLSHTSPSCCLSLHLKHDWLCVGDRVEWV